MAETNLLLFFVSCHGTERERDSWGGEKVHWRRCGGGGGGGGVVERKNLKAFHVPSFIFLRDTKQTAQNNCHGYIHLRLD